MRKMMWRESFTSASISSRRRLTPSTCSHSSKICEKLFQQSSKPALNSKILAVFIRGRHWRQSVPSDPADEQARFGTKSGKTGSVYPAPQFDTAIKRRRPTRCAYWSGREDLNLRHPAPKAGALPGCATPRRFHSAEDRVLSPFSNHLSQQLRTDYSAFRMHNRSRSFRNALARWLTRFFSSGVNSASVFPSSGT